MENTLKLTFIGRDNWERPVYTCKGTLYVDVAPRKNWAPKICTKNSNDFYGEPDTPIKEGTEFIFLPARYTW